MVGQIMVDPNAEDKDKLRAAEIALSHTVPKLEEVSESDNPFSNIHPAQLPGLLQHLDRELATRQNGHANGNGEGA